MQTGHSSSDTCWVCEAELENPQQQTFHLPISIPAAGNCRVREETKKKKNNGKGRRKIKTHIHSCRVRHGSASSSFCSRVVGVTFAAAAVSPALTAHLSMAPRGLMHPRSHLFNAIPAGRLYSSRHYSHHPVSSA